MTEIKWVTAGRQELVTMSNELIEVTVSPNRGADILSVRHLPSNAEILWRDPRSLDNPPSDAPSLSDEASFYDGYAGGMQELFPNTGPACNLFGATLPFHGEACRVAWSAETEISPGLVSLVTQAILTRYPFQLQRTMSISEGSPRLRITSTVTNLTDRALPALWAFHPAFGHNLIAGPTRLYGDFDGCVSHPGSLNGSRTFEAGARVDLMTLGGQTRALDLLRPESHTGDLLYLTSRTGWFAIRNEGTGLTAAMTWPSDVFRCLWLWQECHNDFGYPWWGRHHIVGVEPHSSYPMAGLADAHSRSDALVVRPGHPLTATVTLSCDLTPGDAFVPAGVSTDGLIQWRPTHEG